MEALLISKENVVNMSCALVRAVGSFQLAGQLSFAQIVDRFKKLVKFHKSHVGCYVWRIPINNTEEYTFEKINILGPAPEFIIFSIDHDTMNNQEILDIWDNSLKQLLCGGNDFNPYLKVRPFNEAEWNDLFHRIYDYIWSYNHSED